jgi:hypothetical protein
MLLETTNERDYLYMAAMRGPDIKSDDSDSHLLKELFTAPLRRLLGVTDKQGALSGFWRWDEQNFSLPTATDKLEFQHYLTHLSDAYWQLGSDERFSEVTRKLARQFFSALAQVGEPYQTDRLRESAERIRKLVRAYREE